MGEITIKVLLGLIVCFAIGCNEAQNESENDKPVNSVTGEQEKAAILETINNETKAAFSRDYEGWKAKWVHEPFVTKTYINFPDSSFTETLGWEEVNAFVRDYIEAHPNPDPLPPLLKDIDVRLYGSGAWVTYEQLDSLRGKKREIRLMEKVNGQWKIAGMHTTIYGFED